MKFFAKKSNLVKSGLGLIAIAAVGLNFAQSNNSDAASNVSTTLGQFTKINSAYASGEGSCGTGSGCVLYVNGEKYTSTQVSEP